MKYITFIIPCYNSSNYMRKCIESCLVCKEDAEILIIDDGSTKDNTLDIANEYMNKYNNICISIHKENGGHGSVLNLGIKKATGLYIKVVDSDDWLDESSLIFLLNKIKLLVSNNNTPDLIITNFIYDKVNVLNKKTMEYNKYIKTDKVLTWDDIENFQIGHYLLMHSLMYKNEILQKSNLNLPEKTFYVDNIYAYKPLPLVKSLYYLNIDLYHYYIGREDQSVNEQIMISRLEQQYRVTYYMIDEVDVMNISNEKCRKYMINYLSIVITITSIMSILSNNEKWLNEKKKLWNYIKNKNINLYKILRYSFLGIGVNLNGIIGQAISKLCYRLANKIYGFN